MFKRKTNKYKQAGELYELALSIRKHGDIVGAYGCKFTEQSEQLYALRDKIWAIADELKYIICEASSSINP